jgi:hypothetical protein
MHAGFQPRLSGSRFLSFSWGTPFLRHAYSYHLSRRDHRHNFSPYFYPIYLTYTNASSASSLLSFIPQMILSLGTGLLFGRKNLPLAWFVQTMAFVTLNKVCTSQVCPASCQTAVLCGRFLLLNNLASFIVLFVVHLVPAPCSSASTSVGV